MLLWVEIITAKFRAYCIFKDVPVGLIPKLVPTRMENYLSSNLNYLLVKTNNLKAC